MVTIGLSPTWLRPVAWAGAFPCSSRRKYRQNPLPFPVANQTSSHVKPHITSPICTMNLTAASLRKIMSPLHEIDTTFYAIRISPRRVEPRRRFCQIQDATERAAVPGFTWE